MNAELKRVTLPDKYTLANLLEKHKGYCHIKYHEDNYASVVLWNNIAKKYAGNNYELCIGDEPFDDGTQASVLFFEVK